MTPYSGVLVQLRAWPLNMLLVFGHVYLGCGPLIGPPRAMTSATYTYVLQVAAPAAWGWAMLLGAIPTMAAPWCGYRVSALLHAVAAVPFLAFALLIARAELALVAQGWGGTLFFLLPVAGHVLVVRARRHHLARTTTPGS